MMGIRCEYQRLFDLVRYMRSELYRADLISDSEYSELVNERGSVERLEKYDRLIVGLDMTKAQLDKSNRRKSAWKTAAKWYRSMVGTYKAGCTNRDVIISEYEKALNNCRAKLDERKSDAVEMAHDVQYWTGLENESNLDAKINRRKAQEVIDKYEEESDAKNAHTENT